jgi:short-subunit dehydrogenase
MATDLADRYGVRVEVVVLDLATPDGPSRLCEAADALSFEPTLLVNNAGLGVLGPFTDLPLERAREMVHLNVLALTDLTYRVLTMMQRRGGGAILNVGSASALQPVPHYGVYAATKAYVISFSAALWAEARRHGVQVVAVCPGPVDAGSPDGAAGGSPRMGLRRKVTRERVVVSAFDALERDLPIVVPGAPPRVARFALSLLPRRYRLRLTGLLLRRFPTMLTGIRRREP